MSSCRILRLCHLYDWLVMAVFHSWAWAKKWAQSSTYYSEDLRVHLIKPSVVNCDFLQWDKSNKSSGKSTCGPFTLSASVSRPSCAAPAATHETRKRCSPSVSTCSATNVWRCVTIRDRGSAPSATVPSERMTSTASTSLNSQRDGAARRVNGRHNQRSCKTRDEKKTIYLKR